MKMTKMYGNVVYERQTLINLKYPLSQSIQYAVDRWKLTEQGKYAFKYFKEVKTRTAFGIGGGMASVSVNGYCSQEDYAWWLLRWS